MMRLTATKSALAKPAWRLVLGLVLLWGLAFAAPIHGFLTAGSRLEGDVRAAADSRQNVDVQVILDFDPSPFHLRELQSLGNLGAISGHRIELRRVPSADVDELARIGWISKLELLSP